MHDPVLHQVHAVSLRRLLRCPCARQGIGRRRRGFEEKVGRAMRRLRDLRAVRTLASHEPEGEKVSGRS
jgi:hypothetical protein